MTRRRRTWERVTYRPEGATRSKTIILRDPKVLGKVGGDFTILTGLEVNKEDEEVAPPGVDRREHIISFVLVRRRTPLRMNLKYGELEKDPGGTLVQPSPAPSGATDTTSHEEGDSDV
jgi:hypothetical protein